MNKKSSEKDKTPKWLIFEKEVAKLFELFGYDEVIHNTKIEAGQCDVVAKSKKRNKSNILAECKYHEKPKNKVTIIEVQNFVNKVGNYRMTGEIDQGYLVTNTGFTADARAAINEQAKNYVFLLTYDELIQNLLDVNIYLKGFIEDYDKHGEGDRFIDLKLINTTSLDQTLLDSLPGDIITTKKAELSYLVVPKSYLNEKDNLPFLHFNVDNPNTPILDPVVFVKTMKGYFFSEKEANKKHTDKLINCLLDVVRIVSKDSNDEILHSLFELIPKEKLNMISWSPEPIIKSLLDIWQNYGGDSRLSLYRKSSARKHLKREILAKYKLKSNSIKLDKIKIPSLVSTFWGYIFEGLGIEIGKMESLIQKKETTWTKEDELKNVLTHLERNPDEIKELRFLTEEIALTGLKRHINYSSSQVLVLVGDYGAGKTTMIRRLMRILAEEKLNNNDDPTFRIPLYITLKDYNKAPDIQSLIRLFLQNNVEVNSLSSRTFKKLNEEGRFVLLLDAFDEMLTRVTKADRRRCFNEISELVNQNSKVILTGRPSYFNDYKELKDNLKIMRRIDPRIKKGFITNYEINCLQLLDEEQVELLLKKTSPKDFENIFNLIVSKPNLMDLARRPVITAMMADSGEELKKLKKQEVTVRDIYEIYTNKWVRREEDKGAFRILIHAHHKSTFVRYLAMQMYISGVMSIHYTQLDESVSDYFKLKTFEEMDHFSHDIRTCSFLSRTDDGHYFFIHKSFMEYFVACEFEQMEKSPFCGKFDNSLSNEIIDLLDFNKLPTKLAKLYKAKEDFESCLNLTRIQKTKIVKKQIYEFAAVFRNIEKALEVVLSNYNSIFQMKPNAYLVVFEVFVYSINESYNTSTIQDFPSRRKMIKEIFTSLDRLDFDFDWVSEGEF
ncbi:NACHT domain-containing protein [Dokdonia ponticola]|uniref:NACHT domain-containing protein n=1 Tax=Dokdonia ponticola TaxID=2041041 RepID=A0ABV9HW86_9FLAO